MKTVGFNIKSGIGFGIISGIGFRDTYNPSIHYTWQSLSTDKRYLKDLTSPKKPAELNSGRALKGNGVDQSVTIGEIL